MWRSCLLALLLLPGLAGAEIYRWVDEDGVVHYGDRPPEDAERIEQLPELQRMKAVSPPEEEAETAPARETAPAPQIGIRQPRSEQTFRDPRGRVPVTVELSSELTAGRLLVYYLDGRPAADPTRNRQLRLEGVARGEHRVSVAVVEGGEELARSETVTFFMQPPSALSPGSDTDTPTAPPSGATPGVPQAPQPGDS